MATVSPTAEMKILNGRKTVPDNKIKSETELIQDPAAMDPETAQVIQGTDHRTALDMARVQVQERVTVMGPAQKALPAKTVEKNKTA
jgi:hypothetical protein